MHQKLGARQAIHIHKSQAYRPLSNKRRRGEDTFISVSMYPFEKYTTRLSQSSVCGDISLDQIMWKVIEKRLSIFCTFFFLFCLHFYKCESVVFFCCFCFSEVATTPNVFCFEKCRVLAIWALLLCCSFHPSEREALTWKLIGLWVNEELQQQPPQHVKVCVWKLKKSFCAKWGNSSNGFKILNNLSIVIWKGKESHRLTTKWIPIN